MAHDHRHETGLDTGSHARPIAITLALVVLYMGLEVIGGVVSGSLALFADAGHMLSDAGALALTLFAMKMARRPPTAERTYGYYRAEILAALANGATLVVPGSHTWPEDRVAQRSEIRPAEMPAGSVLYWLGGTLHGAGANVSQDWRYGVILAYSLGWLRQEENQYLDVPPHVAKDLPPALRDIIGYRMHHALGFSIDRHVGTVPD